MTTPTSPTRPLGRESLSQSILVAFAAFCIAFFVSAFLCELTWKLPLLLAALIAVITFLYRRGPLIHQVRAD